ncbi:MULTISPECIES: hypothetical protein [Flammeovirga]|uniref:Uncharacterized protein n=1 Tax=Flammeovirga agarivorans TaxID=2726742 RepID=A0A7X8SME8_9BACT|nr:MULTISPECIES: hypothetical protein [Flammeovirga]NLR92893.1 hypothetical protein [Flammeovirga agarivorans]
MIRKEDRIIPYGQLKGKHHITVNTKNYYVEIVHFKTYAKAHSSYFKVVEAISNYGKQVDGKYDLYDWNYSIYEFEDTLMDLRYFRSLHSIMLIKSESPLKVKQYLKDEAAVIETAKKLVK